MSEKSIVRPLAVLGLLLLSCAPAAGPTPPTIPAQAKVPTVRAKTVAETPVSKPAPPSPSPKAAPMESGRYGGVLSLPAAGDPPNLDIHRNNGVALFALVGPVYNGLVQYDQSNNLVPDLAERWEVSSDGRVYTFFLRQGVKWHDGKPFSSADASYNLERLRQYSGLAEFIGPMENMETPDDRTLKVTLRFRQSGYLPVLGHGRVLMAPMHVIEAEKDLRRVAIGSGPFRLQEYAVGTSFKLQKNKEYFLKQRPYLDGINFYIIRDVSTRFAGFRTGRLQIYGHPPTNGELMTRHKDILGRESPQTVVRLYEPMQAYGPMPNWTRAPWSDVRVRRAAFLVVDREKGIEVVSEGLGSLGISAFYGEWGLPKEELMKLPGFRKPKDEDIAEARRLLAEAGYPQGFKSTVVGRADVPLHEKASTFMRDQLSGIGIDLTIRIIDYGLWTQARARQDYDLLMLNTYADPVHPDGIGRVVSRKLGGTWASGDDDEILELFAKQGRASSVEEQKKAVFDLQRRVAEVVPHIMIAWQDAYIAFSPQVKNYTAVRGMFAHTKLEDIWLAN
ncbi:MAG: ABC transporter substrate-binding protein [Chloroflexi bacterium]|nr:ABC transporter substrate-binding protein [Chloroflexota bacterium]